MINISEPSKYKVIICRCGRIHFIDNEVFMKTVSGEDRLLHICNNCGISTLYGSTYCDNATRILFEKNVYETQLNEKDMSKIKITIANTGYRVYMVGGGYADSNICGIFGCGETRGKVDMRRTIRSIQDPDKVLALSKLDIPGLELDWSGTKYHS